MTADQEKWKNTIWQAADQLHPNVFLSLVADALRKRENKEKAEGTKVDLPEREKTMHNVRCMICGAAAEDIENILGTLV